MSQQKNYLINRQYSIGVYLDMKGYGITLMETNKVYIPLAREEQGFIAANREQYQEATLYRLIKGSLSIDRSELSIKGMCKIIETLIGNCEENLGTADLTLYYNELPLLDKILPAQLYPAKLVPIRIDPMSSITLINCLLIDKLLTISEEDNLANRYKKALIDYSDPGEVNHALFSLALNLEKFESGGASWARSLENIEKAVMEIE
jgi:hypothetical protein